jgi:hypothetical protein
MARSSTTFKKGQVTNPNGKAKLPDDLRALMNATSAQAKRDLCECYNTKLDTLKGLALRGNEVSAGLAMIAACIVNGVETGDNRILATFLDRLIGKPREIEELDPESDEESRLDRIKRIRAILDDDAGKP